MAGLLQLRHGVGERMLLSKLQVLNGTSPRRTSLALRMLTGRSSEPVSSAADLERLFDRGERVTVEPLAVLAVPRQRRRYTARTVYLSDRHLRDVDRIIEAWQHGDARRPTRSAVLRRAVEYLRHAVETDPATCTLEND
ncbi:MAG: hypothetical protein LC797_05095 [Chloroflexi bacterium]|nr:hypothetical protein [Chloroflexota bacterium]